MTEQKIIEQRVSVIRNVTLLGELVDVGIPDASVAEVDATSFDSPDMIEQVIAGWIKQGKGSFTLNHLPITAHDDLLDDVYDRATDLWTFILPTSGRAISFSGFIQSVTEKVPLKDGNQITVNITPQTKRTRITTVSTGVTTPFVSITNQATEPLTLSPAAAASVHDYTVTSYSDDTGVKVTVTATAGTIYINGTVVATGVASSAITIGTTTGSITNIPIIVWEANKVPQIYWIRVIKGTVASPP